MTYDTLNCPKCGHESVLAEAPCLVQVGPGVSGIPYGQPVVLFLLNDAQAVCNSSSCKWHGTVGDVRRAAIDAAKR